ncbi:MAG: hypothetical protein ACRERW_04035 [Pseudomonas sp.]
MVAMKIKNRRYPRKPFQKRQGPLRKIFPLAVLYSGSGEAKSEKRKAKSEKRKAKSEIHSLVGHAEITSSHII